MAGLAYGMGGVAMGELAGLFELMQGAPESFRTLRARLRRWSDHAVRDRALERYSEQLERRQGGGSIHMILSGGDGQEEKRPAVSEELTRLWLEPPDRVRVEVDGEYPRTRVRNGNKAWVRMGEWGTLEQEVEGAEGEIGEQRALLNSLALASGLAFELLGQAVVAGREGTRVRATPRDSGEPVGFGLGAAGADEFELVVDGERGIVLRSEARLVGEPFEIVEFGEIVFDQPLDGSLFVYTPEAGETVRSVEEMTLDLQYDLTLEQAAARASFPLFVPAEVGPTMSMDVHYMAGRERPPISENVTVFYHDPEGVREFGPLNPDPPRAAAGSGTRQRQFGGGSCASRRQRCSQVISSPSRPSG